MPLLAYPSGRNQYAPKSEHVHYHANAAEGQARQSGHSISKMSSILILNKPATLNASGKLGSHFFRFKNENEAGIASSLACDFRGGHRPPLQF
jgi:hypothetical protein